MTAFSKLAGVMVLIAAAGLSSAPPAGAADGVLDRVAETGAFRIGYATGSPPLSFNDADGNPAGYSIELCRHIGRTLQRELGLPKLEFTFVPLVSMQDRLKAVEQGDVDIECGATTVTLSRRERVDFTLMTFITGSAVLSRKAAPIASAADLADKVIAVMPDTTTEDVLRQFAEVNETGLKLALVETHGEGMALLNGGKVDGFASDRAMLIGQVFTDENARNEYEMTRSVLSFEPYALMVPRGDTRFRLAADRALAELYRSARIRRLYQDWFGRYGEPLSPIVEAMYQFQAVGE
ncbi:amino acid ABC transporter substrate-binding protein [Lentisalinibacter orientalis]|uniref:amino acid ABC transporter substrate-binding protein n=1 Tax=Lentisalinibacter orientalis TaxID=2992241 RepID=UPI00386D594B